MEPDRLRQLAQALLSGERTIDEFMRQVSSSGIADLGEAQVDLDRRHRCGFPEVLYGPGKTVAALEKIAGALVADGVDALVTRISPEQATGLLSKFPTGRYNPLGRTFRIPLPGAVIERDPETSGRIVIVTAGTSDQPVAEEARETAEWMGVSVRLIQDVGVAGPNRLRAQLPNLAGADAIVVVAGMEGALPSVVGGHVDCPVIAVPTSVGYGASFGGIAALLGMLNSCASNVTVVNIDAGFKGAYVAGMIARNVARGRRK
ncbi:MAG: nickel pincer cofactor biosynthesis protein LarB [Planctomycetes bacterium]|nr:nickel pincer cofactor biosynthesis protein LarB [Planctomycetota bacterium]